MSTTLTLPAAGQVARLLTGIVGRTVTAASRPRPGVQKAGVKFYGVFRESVTGAVSVCVCDLALCASASGAMLLFPLPAVKEAVRTGRIEDGMLDAVREIFNICARLFNDRGHYVFENLHASPETLAGDAAAVVREPSQQVEIDVTIPEYGGGAMRILIGEAQ